MVNNMHDRNAGYLTQLVVEKEMLKLMPWELPNAGRLLDQEITRIQVYMCPGHSLANPSYPNPDGPVVTLCEKIFIPKDPPNYNYVGRILGPRGLTAKDLELKTGTKIQIRGRGSLRDDRKEAMNRGKEGWEHLEEDLHISIECTESANRAQVKLNDAVKVIKDLLVIPADGMDELKRTQLMHLAFIEGTYSQNKGKGRHSFNAPNSALYASSPAHQGLYPTHQDSFSAYNSWGPMYSPIHPFSPSPFGPQDIFSFGRPESPDSYEAFTKSPLTMFSPPSRISSPACFEKTKPPFKPTLHSVYQTPKSSRSFKFNQSAALGSSNWRFEKDKDDNMLIGCKTIEIPTTGNERDPTNDLTKSLMFLLDEDVAQVASNLEDFLSGLETLEDCNWKKPGSKNIFEKP